jgi:hypothetical protein
MMVRVFDGVGESFTSEQHVDAEIPGSVRVIIDESADPQAVVTRLLHIAHWFEREARVAADPNNNWLDEGEK